MGKPMVKLGFVASHRWGFTPWCAELRDGCLAALATIDGLEIVVPSAGADKAPADAVKGLSPSGGINSLDTAEAMAEYFASQKVDGLIVVPLDFGDERSAAKVAELVGVPVLLVATKEPAGREDAGLSRVSDSYCGNLAIAAALHRRKVGFHFAGVLLPQDAEFGRQVRDFVGAVAVVKALRGARIGQIGVRPAPFESVVYDESALIERFGQNVIVRELSEVLAAAAAIPANDARLVETVGQLRGGVAEVSVADEYLLSAGRLELALRDFCTANRLSGLAVQCWSEIQRLGGLSACATLGRLTESGIMAACEVDVLGAVSMMASYASAGGVCPPHLIDWTIQHREDPNRLLAWHCGNAPVCLAADKAKTALRSRRDMAGASKAPAADAQSGLYQFQLKPGPVTFCRLAHYDGEFKMLIAAGEIEQSPETLAGTWSWVRVSDHARLYRTLVEEGFIHHASMMHGRQQESLKLACKFLAIRPVVVE